MINIRKLMDKVSGTHPKERTLYAITEGIHKGMCILFFDISEAIPTGTHKALAFCEDKDSVGGMKVFDIPVKATIEGFDKKIIEPVKKIPRNINKSLYKEYLHRKTLVPKIDEKDDFNTQRERRINEIRNQSINNYED